MKFEVNYLLSIARYTERFYPLLMLLSGRDAIYKNPGVSLRSFVLSGTNSLQESINLEFDEEVRDIVRECESFVFDQGCIEDVRLRMMKQPYDIVEQIQERTGDTLTTKEMMSRIAEMNARIDDTWMMLTTACAPGKPELSSIYASDYKQALYDMKLYADELTEALNHIQGKTA